MTTARARRSHPAPRDWTTSSLGERVEHVCQLRGWSLNRLGDEAGLASGVMSRLAHREANVAGAPDTLARVADAAGISVLWLMLGRGPVELPEEAAPSADPRPPEGSAWPRNIKLRTHPDWAARLTEAKRWQRGIPDEIWELAGDMVIPSPPRLDWQLIVGIVREAYSAQQRWLADSAHPGGADPEGSESGPRADKPRSGVKRR